MIILSLSTFFHFLLDHRLGVIDDWLFEYAWQLITVSKFLGFVTLASFYVIKFDTGNPLVSLFYDGNKKIDEKVIKLILFIISSIIFFGSFTSNPSFKNVSTTCLPKKPVPPVTTICLVIFFF